MKFGKLSESYRNMSLENTWSRIAIVALVAINGFLVHSMTSQSEIVTMIPYGIQNETSVSEEKADGIFHESWSVFVAELVGNITPSKAKFVKSTLDPLLAPSIHGDVMILLEREIDIVTRDKVTFDFEPKEISFDPDTQTTYVTGNHYTNELSGERKRRIQTYEFKWEIKNYTPTLKYMTAYKGAPRIEGERK